MYPLGKVTRVVARRHSARYQLGKARYRGERGLELVRDVRGELAPQRLPVLLFGLVEDEYYCARNARIGLDGAAEHTVKAPVRAAFGFAACAAERAGKQLSEIMVLGQRQYAAVAALRVCTQYLECAVVVREYVAAMIDDEDALLHMRYRLVELRLFQPELTQPRRDSAALILHLCNERGEFAVGRLALGRFRVDGVDAAGDDFARKARHDGCGDECGEQQNHAGQPYSHKRGIGGKRLDEQHGYRYAREQQRCEKDRNKEMLFHAVTCLSCSRHRAPSL